jgi:hypothetical protein
MDRPNLYAQLLNVETKARIVGPVTAIGNRMSTEAPSSAKPEKRPND